MAAAPAAAAEGVVLSYIAVGLLAAVMFVVALGLHGAWVRTFGAIFSALGGVKISLGFGQSVHPLRFLEDASNGVANGFLAIAKGSQHSMGYLFHGAAVIQGWIAKEIVGLATDVLGWGRWLQHVHLPKYVRYALYAAFPPALLAKLIQGHAIPKIIQAGRATTHAATHAATHTTTRVMHATAGAIPLPFPWIHVAPRLGALERSASRLARRLRRVEALVGVTALAAAMANVLGLPNWRCLTRGNIGRGARAFCGLDKWLVDFLLLGSIEAFIVTDLCAFTSLLADAARAARPALFTLVEVEGALVTCNGAKPLEPLRLPALDVPPLYGVSPLAV